MSLKSKQGQRVSVQVGVAAAAAVTALVGFSGPAAALPSDQVVHFVPTLVRVPGGCSAIVNAETVPQPQAGHLGVRVKIIQDGQNCQPYRISVRWKNLDTGRENSQSHRVDANGVIEQAPDGVITGFGMGPGPGRVEAKIVATTDTYPQHYDLEQLSGQAWITLNQ
ncbi:hypothetical protein [Nocardia ignorata]|uniref:DUF2141 domain-containing protein n=1 Tax=Nocardia ignorata TaxID=145285 RepID=A0A4R6PTX4_NOCIG|nr:hypothetical protein [Nocardia ignorata]TDP42288.1 hypothetical protein DFR75_1011398 [Nocardia ignorata]